LADKTWETMKIRHCEHAGCEVALEAEVIYPAEQLPDMSVRVNGHRCSHAVDCMLFSDPSCIWSGGNTTYDPFKES
jgi:hypothetical protein